jgi:hypothetical protein
LWPVGALVLVAAGLVVVVVSLAVVAGDVVARRGVGEGPEAAAEGGRGSSPRHT